MSISTNIESIRQSLPKGVKLIVVTKTRSNDEIIEAYAGGHRDFGENKVQDLVRKAKELPKDIRWHLIGHLQSNKVRSVVPFANTIHSVDSLNLLLEIHDEAIKAHKSVDCLLQFHIAKELSKFGFSGDNLDLLLKNKVFSTLTNVRIRGVMGMATFTDDEKLIREEFRNLKIIFEELKLKLFKDDPDFKEISMGMSDDYLIAIEEGSTMVRVGTAIFGSR